VAGQGQREGELLDGEGAGDPGLGQRGDDVGVDVEVAEQRRGLLDRGAAEGLDGLLELLRVGRAGLGVLERGVRGGLGGGGVGAQFSRLGICTGRGRAGVAPGVGPRAVGCRARLSSADTTGRPGGEARSGPVAGVPGGTGRERSGGASAHVEQRAQGLADSHASAGTG
jgi:hypothetical protein